MVENAVRILVSRFRVLLVTMEKRSRAVGDIVYTSRSRADRAPNPRNDGAAIQNN